MRAGAHPGGGVRVDVDWCRAEQLQDLAAFIDAHWKRNHILSRDLELVRWQHPPPRGRDDAFSVLVATAGGEITGILGLIEFELCDHGRADRGAWLTTWAAPRNPELPHVGLRLLERALGEGYAMVGTLAGNEVTQRILGAYGFEVRDEVGRWVRVVDAERARPLAGDRARPAAPFSAAGIDLAEWADAAAAWDQAWRDRFAPRIVGTCRSARFVEHRYARHPRFRYEIKIPIRDGRAAGLIVYRIERVTGVDVVVARLVEFLAAPEAEQEVAQAVIALSGEANAAVVDFYCTGDALARPLELAGFHREQPHDRIPSRFQPLDPTPRAMTAAFRWREGVPRADPNLYFTRSDCDQDRPN